MSLHKVRLFLCSPVLDLQLLPRPTESLAWASIHVFHYKDYCFGFWLKKCPNGCLPASKLKATIPEVWLRELHKGPLSAGCPRCIVLLCAHNTLQKLFQCRRSTRHRDMSHSQVAWFVLILCKLKLPLVSSLRCWQTSCSRYVCLLQVLLLPELDYKEFVFA